MFYVAAALLDARGLRFRKHSGVHAAFGKHFAKTGELDPSYHRWLLEAFSARMEADYGLDAELEPTEVQQTIYQAEEFLTAARAYLDRGGEGSEDVKPPA